MIVVVLQTLTNHWKAEPIVVQGINVGGLPVWRMLWQSAALPAAT